MRHVKFILLVGVAVVLVLTGWALAQGKSAQGGQGAPMTGCQGRFDSLDADHDGKITLEEFNAVPHHRGNAEQAFKAMDRDGNGTLSKDEFCSGKGMGKGMGKGASQ